MNLTLSTHPPTARLPRCGRIAPFAALLLAIALPAHAQAPATQPSVHDLLARQPAPTPADAHFDFSAAPLTDVIAFINKTYKVQVINPFPLDQQVTIKLPDPLSAADAFTLLDQTLLPLGYTLLQTVSERNSGALELRIVVTTSERNIPVYMGSDPAAIPATEEVRTQVLTLKSLPLDKARELVATVLAKRADVVINPGPRTLILTDSSSRIRTAAAMLQVLEKQAADAKSPLPSQGP